MNALTERAWHDGAVTAPSSTFNSFFRDPHIDVVSRGRRTWYISGLRFNPDELWKYRLDRPGVEEEVCRQWKDIVIVRMELGPAGDIVEAKCWKGLTAGYDVYYGKNDDGCWVIADNFSEICSALGKNERVVSEDAILDHLLFRAVPTDDTHIASVKRLGFGCSVTLSADRSEAEVRRFDQIAPGETQLTKDQFTAEVDLSLGLATAGLAEADNMATLFTGGIDSTLVQSYSNGRSTPINVEPECLSDSWHFQLEYARRAAKLTGKELVGVPISLNGTIEEIVSAIRLAGLPQRDFHTLLWPSAFRSNYDVFLTGERADALFGSKGAREAKAAYWLLAAAPFLFAGEDPPKGFDRQALKQLWKAGYRLTLPAGDPFGFAAIRSCGDYTNLPWLKEIFGPERVRDRIQRRFDFVLDQINPAAVPAHPFYRRLFLAHWTTFWSTEELARMRQIAHGLGKVVYAPFATGPVVDTCRSVRPEDRYVRWFQTKHILKSLLRERVPDYPTSQRKGVTGLDFEKLYRSGTLGPVWEMFEFPDFVSDDWRRQALACLGDEDKQTPLPPLCWPVLNLAIWQKEVLSA